MDLKFVSHGLWSEEQNILLQNNLKHENEAGGGGGLAIQLRFRV